MHFEVEEQLSLKELSEEYIMMRLRLSDGLSLSEFQRKFGEPIDPKYIERMNPFLKSGHIKNKEDRYYFTADGMYVSNYILSDVLDLNA